MLELIKKLDNGLKMVKAVLQSKANVIHFHDDRYTKLDTCYTREEMDIKLELMKTKTVTEYKEADLSPIYSELKELSVKLNEKIALYDSKINNIEGIIEAIKPKTEE